MCQMGGVKHVPWPADGLRWRCLGPGRALGEEAFMVQVPFPQAHRISLCMIVRNEAQNIEAALASAKPWVGEMLVVDTGSTDNTVALAEAMGAKVLHHPWGEDFAEARNVGLEAASAPWVLVLDADERFEVQDPAELGRVVSQEALQGISFRIHNALDDGTESVATVFRLFRRDLPGMRYRGALHEQVVAVSEGKVNTAALACARLHHSGYLEGTVQGQNKRERNVRLAEKLVAQQPEDPYAHYALGLAFQQSRSWTQASEAYQKALALLPPGHALDAFVLSLYVYAVRMLRLLQQPEAAMALVDRGLQAFPESPDLRVYRGQMHLEASAWGKACQDLRKALSVEASHAALIEEPGNVAWEARTALALGLSALGQSKEAEALLVKAVAESPPSFTKAHRLLGSLRLEQGRWAEAAELLERAMAHSPEEVRFNLAWAKHKLGLHEAAVALLTPIAHEAQAQLLLGRVHLAAGKASEALPFLVASSLPAAALPRGWAFYLCGEAQAASAAWAEWMGAGAGDWAIKDALALAMGLLAGDAVAVKAPERPAEAVQELGNWLRLLLRHQRFEDVERLVEGASRLPEGWWKPLRREWGIALSQEGFAALALELLLPAREAAPQDAEIYAWLGMAALEQGHADVAGDMWCVALELAPQHPIALEGLRLLGASAAAPSGV